jgi:hypothetical protein
LDKKDVKPNLYSYSELKAATQEFHSNNELGRGGFGVVYKVCTSFFQSFKYGISVTVMGFCFFKVAL